MRSIVTYMSSIVPISPTVVDESNTTFTVDFNGHLIRATFHNEELHFSIVDVIDALGVSGSTDTYASTRVWNAQKRRMSKRADAKAWLDSNVVRIRLLGKGGRKHFTDTVNTHALLRIVQSISSPQAESVKGWLASVGCERLAEERDPSLAMERAIRTYRARGRDDHWIQLHFQGKAARKRLTSEWGRRGVEGDEYGRLSNVVHLGAFGIPVESHRRRKSLTRKHDSLRDNMSPLELAITMLAEESTTQLTVHNNAQGFQQSQQAAIAGSEIAGRAREDLEGKGVQVISPDNYLPDRNQQQRRNTLNSP